MIGNDYWTKYFTLQPAAITVEPYEKTYTLAEIRDWCELSLSYLQFKRAESSQLGRFDAAFERFQRDLAVLDMFKEQQKVEKISLEALYKITGARNLNALTLTPHEAIEILNSARGDQNDDYTIALHDAVTTRSLFMQTGNPSYFVSAMVDVENALRTAEYSKLGMVFRDRLKTFEPSLGKHEL